MKHPIQILGFIVISLLPWLTTEAVAQELSLSWATTYGHGPSANLMELPSPVLLNGTNGTIRLFGECHAGRGAFRMGTNRFASTVIDGVERLDIYMARLDAHGQPVSVKILPTTGRLDVSVLAAAADATGNVLMVVQASLYSATATLGGMSLPAGVGKLLVMVDSNDEFVWAMPIGMRADSSTPGGITRVGGVTMTVDGSAVLGGEFSGRCELGGAILDEADPTVRHMFIAKLSSEGEVIWVRSAAGVESGGVATDAGGNIFVGGLLSDGADFEGERTIRSSGGKHVFVARYSTDGELDWVFVSDTDRFQGLRIARDGKPMLVHYSGPPDGEDQLHLTVLDGLGNPVALLPPVLTSTGGSIRWLPFVGMEVGDSDELLLVASAFSNSTLHFGDETLSLGAGEERLLFGGSLNSDGTWNWLRPVARPRFATNATPERYFLPGARSLAEMRGFCASRGVLRFAGVYLSPAPLAIADGVLPSTGRNDSQLFVAELAINPPAPRLTVIGSNASLKLSWPSSATGFVLQQATTLVDGGDWQSAALQITRVGRDNLVTLDPSGPAAFFRLRGP